MTDKAPLLVLNSWSPTGRSTSNDDCWFLMQELKKSGRKVIEANTRDAAVTYLSELGDEHRPVNPVFSGILVLTEDITRIEADRHTFGDNLNRYARNGGTVVFASQFSGATESKAFDDLFRKLGLSWTFQRRGLAAYQLNTEAGVSSSGYLSTNNLPELCCHRSLLTVTVKDKKEVLYGGRMTTRLTDAFSSAVSIAQVGAGRIALLGDVECARETRELILAIFKLEGSER